MITELGKLTRRYVLRDLPCFTLTRYTRGRVSWHVELIAQKTLEDENARLVAENDALRAQVEALNRRLGMMEQQTGADYVAWKEVEEFRTQAERALRRLDDFVAQRLKSSSGPSYPTAPDLQSAIRPGSCCGGQPQLCNDANASCSMILPPTAAVSIPPVYTEYDSQAVDMSQQSMPYAQSMRDGTVVSGHQTTNWRGYAEPDPPTFRPDYPQSNEREECCLGLISCEPTIVQE